MLIYEAAHQFIFLHGYRKAKLLSTVKNFKDDIMTSLDHAIWPFVYLFQIRWHQSKPSKAIKYWIFSTDSFHRYINMAGVI